MHEQMREDAANALREVGGFEEHEIQALIYPDSNRNVRDLFIAASLTGILALPSTQGLNYSQIAEIACEQADHVLEKRGS